jgi:sugar lactone lactonase YvrE
MIGNNPRCPRTKLSQPTPAMMIITRRLRLLVTTAALAAAPLGALRAEDYSLITFAGAANNTTGADGTPGSFNNPYGVAIDAAKNIYVADSLNHTIRKITPGRVVSTLAGTARSSGTADGTGAAARFNFPVGIAVDSAGNVFVAETTNNVIRKITPAGVVTTFAGTALQIGSTDGTGPAARFFLPAGLAIDSADNLYLADSANNTIRKITPAGVVTTLAGAALQPGFTNATGAAARFTTPFGVAVDGAGNVFVADSGNNAIRRITPGGVVTTVAGAAASGAIDGPAAAARFSQPRGVAVDAGGNLFVADYGNSTLRHITAGGAVTTIAGAAGIFGEVNSVGAAARLYEPIGIVVDGTTVYVADSSNNQIRRGQPASSAPLADIAAHPLDQEVSVGQAVSFSVVATGGTLQYQWLRNNTAIDGATGATYAIASAQTSDTAAYSVRVSNSSGAKDSNQATLAVLPVLTSGISITARPVSLNVNPGQPAAFSVTATGTGLAYQWFKNGATISGATAASYTIAAAQSGDAAAYTVRLTQAGNVATVGARLSVGGVAGPNITVTTQPQGATRDVGQAVTFTVAATTTAGTLTYQWLKDENSIPGATAASYSIPSVQVASAGNYSVRLGNGSINVLSATATLVVNNPPPPGPTSRLSNLSVRTAMAAGQTLIVGVVVSGGGARSVLVRGAGPALAAFGLAGAMADPRLELFNGSTSVLTNDNWPASLAPTFLSVGAFAFPAGSLDAAFVQGIDGGRTIQARGTGAGVLLVEAYDLGEGNSPRMINVSARNQVGVGADILIAGFNILGTGEKRLLIRAVGPTLAAFGVGGALVDPVLEVYSGSTKIAENDNWAASLVPTFNAVGAFQLTAGSRDAALLTSLAPGAYTVQVRGVANGTGEGLIEIYEVP